MAGGAAARPFKTFHNTLDMDLKAKDSTGAIFEEINCWWL